MVVVDSHQHLWDPSVPGFPTIPPEASVLARAFLHDECRTEIRTAGVDYTVLVQGHPQSPEGNRWLFEQANAADYIAGVVAWANLLDPDHLGSCLDCLGIQPKFVGIRHIVEDEPDLDWIIRPPAIESLAEIARRGLTYDMLVRPRHLANVLNVLDSVPGIRMVIDHIAKPDIAGGGSSGWAEDMARIAEHPQAYCKLSGMITEADWHKWQPLDLAPYVHHVIEVFGWDRVMFGSDWPVCLLAGDYQRVWAAINEVLEDITQTQREKLFGANAIKFYGLKI